MANFKLNPLTPQDAVGLAPLVNSHEADALESELKALFKLMYDTYIKPAERTTNTLGTPHIGPFDQVERAVKAEGLALTRRGTEDAMRYLFRAWRARNPKRGLHMLRAYLQVLWPNGWDMNQLWQGHAAPYPTLSTLDLGNHYLTSRVAVLISSSQPDGADVLAATPALRSVLPARMLLKVALRQKSEIQLSIATSMYAGVQIQSFAGDFTREPEYLAMANLGYLGAGIEMFTGTFS